MWCAVCAVFTLSEVKLKNIKFGELMSITHNLHFKYCDSWLIFAITVSRIDHSSLPTPCSHLVQIEIFNALKPEERHFSINVT